MNPALVSFLERRGLKIDWRCRPSFLIRLFASLAVFGGLWLLWLVASPQSSRMVYIFQSIFTERGGSHPWGAEGPNPPENYTGTWLRWHWNGRRSFEEHYVSGQLE